MKRIQLFAMFLVLGISIANAWTKNADEAVVVLATKHLSVEAKETLIQYLGDTYLDDVQYLNTLERKKIATHTKEIHFLHLDKEYRPLKVEGDDALKAIEQSLTVIRARHSHSKSEVVKALRVVINLMCDIHNFSRVRIEGIPHSQGDFKFYWTGGDAGSRKNYKPVAWSHFWNAYGSYHVGMSGSLWAEDLSILMDSSRKSFSDGDLNKWVAQIGTDAAKLYTSWAKPDYQMTRRQRNELEELNSEMMARAAYRLAVLLNEAIK